MIGINIGSLNSSIALGKIQPSQLTFKSELLLSDTSLRTCPSIIAFTQSHRLFGDQASLIAKKNLNSSFQNINRLIGFDMNIPFSQEEYNNYLYIGGEYKPELKKFSSGNDECLLPEEIVISYIHLLYNSYILEKNIEAEHFVFSVPDYFTCFHKNLLKTILESINLKKKYAIINESSAITLYFGNKNYKEYFIHKRQVGDKIVAEVDPNLIKYVLFIDAGHSKISFIFSKLSYNLFQVLNTSTIPFLGGRDFDNRIYEHCIENFKNNYGIDLSNDKKIKLRLINPIMKARKALTVNKDVQINVDSLKDDKDLSLLITREDFEKLISKELNLFRNELKKFCEYNEKNFKEAMLTNIEMAGELMRTPCLQNIVKEVTGLSISKTIITDECIAIGCSLYGALLNETFPIKDFNGIYHLNNYTINISINNEPISKFIGNNEYLPSYKTYSFDEKYFNSVNSKINISFYYDTNEIKNYLSSNSGLLLTYEFDCNEIEKENGGMKNVRITFLISRIGNIHIHSIESRIFEEQYMKIEINDKIFKTINSEIYQGENQKGKMIEEFKSKEKAMFERDRYFKNYSKSKNNILTKLYNIKNKINDNGLGDKLFGERKVNEVLDEIEMKLNSDNQLFNLDELSQHLDNILNNFISDDIKTKTRELLNKISDYQNKLSEEYTKLLSGGQCSLEENQINDASNMMEHFIKRLNLILSKDELNNVQIEFEKEIKKYFN